jgi:hypothetical protein
MLVALRPHCTVMYSAAAAACPTSPLRRVVLRRCRLPCQAHAHDHGSGWVDFWLVVAMVLMLRDFIPVHQFRQQGEMLERFFPLVIDL